MNDTPPIPVILGATATGKTAVGIELARLMNGEVISIDSRKVYKYLTIGTATPRGTWENNRLSVEGIVHHLMGFLDPNKQYNAGDFARDAGELIDDILKRGKRPILVGGTGFYFKALAVGLPSLPPTDESLREKWTSALNERGHKHLYLELQNLDPEAARHISPQDSHKLIRALEVCELTGQPFSAWKRTSYKKSPHRFVVIGLEMGKDELNQKIEARSKRMLEEGMIEETAAVLQKGFSKSCAALSSFGYKEAVRVVEGKLTRGDFLAALIQGTRSYAKRQHTWFRTQVKPLWFDSSRKIGTNELSMNINGFLNNLPSHLIYSPHA